MRKVFDHPIQGKEASSRLLSLSQGSSTVSQFAVDFRILECGWGESASQWIFVKGLSEELKDELAAREETSSLDELISLATRLDNRLRERRRERAAGLRPPYSPSPPWSARPPAFSPLSPGPPASSGSPSAPSSLPRQRNLCNDFDDGALGSAFTVVKPAIFSPSVQCCQKSRLTSYRRGTGEPYLIPFLPPSTSPAKRYCVLGSCFVFLSTLALSPSLAFPLSPYPQLRTWLPSSGSSLVGLLTALPLCHCSSLETTMNPFIFL